MVMCYLPTTMHIQEGFDGNFAPSEVQIIMDQLPKSRLGLGFMRFGPMRFGEASLFWRVETELYIYTRRTIAHNTYEVLYILEGSLRVYMYIYNI